jgi:hypothetical protein
MNHYSSHQHKYNLFVGNNNISVHGHWNLIVPTIGAVQKD